MDQQNAGSPPTGKEPSRFAILKNRNFLYYWVATIFSIIGEHIENVIRNWLIWELTHSVFWLMAMVFAHWIPFALFSIIAGSVADRVNRQRFIIWAEVGTCIAAVGMFTTTYLGIMDQYWMGALLIIHSIAGAMGHPCRQLFLHDMVGREQLMSGVALTSSLRFATQSIGKPIGGFILLTLGAAFGFFVNAVAFLPLILVLMSVIRVSQQEISEKRSAYEDFKQGLSHIGRERSILAVLCIAVAPSIFVGNGFDPFLVIYSDTVFRMGATGYTYFITAVGIGSLVAVVTLSWIGDIWRKGQMLIMSIFGYCASILVFAFSRSMPFSLIALFTYGFAQVIHNSSATALLLESVPSDMRGRVMGIFNFGRLGLRVLNGPFFAAANKFVLLMVAGTFVVNAFTLAIPALTVALLTFGLARLAPSVGRQE